MNTCRHLLEGVLEKVGKLTQQTVDHKTIPFGFGEIEHFGISHKTKVTRIQKLMSDVMTDDHDHLPVVIDANSLIVGARGDETAVRGEPCASHPILVIGDGRDESPAVHGPQLDTLVVRGCQEVLPIHRVELDVSAVWVLNSFVLKICLTRKQIENALCYCEVNPYRLYMKYSKMSQIQI